MATIRALGSSSDPLGDAFDSILEPVIILNTPSEVRLRNPENNFVTVFTGTGLGFDGLGDPFGTLSGVAILNGTGIMQLALTGILWNFGQFSAAMEALIDSDDDGPLNVLLNLQPVTFDASASSIRVDHSFSGVTAATTILGSNFEDTLEGGSGNDTIFGYGGNDVLIGNGGNDTLEGGDGADTLNGGTGNDIMVGGAGNDVYIVDSTSDRVFETTTTASLIDAGGIDRVDSSVSYSLDTSAGVRFVEHLTLTGTGNISGTGNALANILTGNSGNNVLNGGLGNDTVNAGAGNDLLHGGSGDDELDGHGGNDSLFGGLGNDLLLGAGGNDLLFGESRNDATDDLAAQVFRLYQTTLGRDPDVGGHMAWVDRLEGREVTLQEAAGRFVTSAEFRSRFDAPDAEAFITLMYQNVLERSPDPAGLAVWVARLETGGWSNERVVVGFSESAEFRTNTTAEALNFSHAGFQADWSDDVFRLYQATLGRAPDQGGLLGWSERLADGRTFLDVVDGFVASVEFQNRYGTTTTDQFVTLLYQNVLGRTPDPTGFATWTSRIDTGDFTRAHVVQGFSQSREFVTNSTPDLVDWMRAQGTNDALSAGGGRDVLFGGILSDHFIFTPEAGARHQVADLEAWDRLDFTSFGYTSGAEVVAQMSQRGADVVFEDADVMVTFYNTNLGLFEENMFL